MKPLTMLDSTCAERQGLHQWLDKLRPYLLSLASQQLDACVRTRVDPSDIVQETLLEAFRDIDQFQGAGESEFVSWLRQILRHNIDETVSRHVFAQKRAVHRERHLEETRGDGWSLSQTLATRQSTPCEQAMQQETRQRLERLLQKLPDRQQEAIRLRYLHGWTMDRLTDHFGCSSEAVAGLIKRGLRKLRTHLDEIAHG